MLRSKKLVRRECLICGSEFFVKAHQIKRGRGKYCSFSCNAVASARKRDSAGEKNSNWKGGNSPRSASNRRYVARHPEKHAAHLAVKTAIRNGVLIRMNCEICNAEKSEAHHDDYSKQLEVRWLCRKHHLEAHKPSHSLHCGGSIETWPAITAAAVTRVE